MTNPFSPPSRPCRSQATVTKNAPPPTKMHTSPSVVLPSTTCHAPTPHRLNHGHQDNQHGDCSTYRYPVGGRRASGRTVRRDLLAETAQWTVMKEGLLGGTLSVSSRSELEEARLHVAGWLGPGRK